ncbi:MAG: hypothetical protein OQK12_13290 [Motiliproteus sp.]|nr:hypothetical protein [Motiliproteus sp.]MCW9054136.1 hypothetical protein [Motiliproteus sp.]
MAVVNLPENTGSTYSRFYSRFYPRLVSAMMRCSPSLTRKLVFAGWRLQISCPNDFSHEGLSSAKGGVSEIARSKSVMGIHFDNALGVAAGFDRFGQIGDGMGKLGFGHLEIGTVTPADMDRVMLPSPRENGSFRLGANIGKQLDSSLADGVDDYLQGLQWAWPFADYIVINLSGGTSRSYLQSENFQVLEFLLNSLKQRQVRLAEQTLRFCPLVVKLNTRVGLVPLRPVLDLILKLGFDGVMAAEDVGKGGTLPELDQCFQQQVGARLTTLKQYLGEDVALISVGGMATLADAEQRMLAGASLVQMHNALVYRGPILLREISAHCMPVH